MLRLLIIALLSSCVGDPVSEKQIATYSDHEVDDSRQYFYEAYKMTGYHNDRYLAVKIEILEEMPQKIYFVNLASSKPWAKISEVVEVVLDCSASTYCQGKTDAQEFILSWAEKAQVVSQLAIHHDQDDGTRQTHVYNRVITVIGEQLELAIEVIQQRYFDDSTPVDLDGFSFLVGGQEDSFTVEVDQVFNVSFKMKDSNSKIARSPKGVRIEAHDSNGNIIEEVLAGAGTLDYDLGTIFNPNSSVVLMVTTLTSHYSVFLVPEAIDRGVTKLVGYAEGSKVGEVDINLLPSSRTLTVESDGSETRYIFTPVPDTKLEKGHYRWLDLTLKELDSNGVITGNSFDAKHDPHSGGTSTYSDNRPDDHFIGIDGLLPCTAPNTIYGWLQKDITGKKIPRDKRKLYRVDCP